MRKTIVIDDRELMIPVYSEVCTFCKHWDVEANEPRVCAAFPDGIPMLIWLGKNNHREPVEGDHGIQFELAEGIEDPDA
jgi:hypothetical protein